jgi:uncharacterized membrane protein YkoI
MALSLGFAAMRVAGCVPAEQITNKKSKHEKNRNMKTKTIICAVLTVGLLAGGLASALAAEKAEKAEKKDKDAKLEAKAKITKAEAEKTALTKAPGGTIKEGELEEENGKLIWSFDISMPNTKDITEVQVDAVTGDVVDVAKETPADQEKEAKEKVQDAKEKKQAKEKKSEQDDDGKDEKK